MLIVIKILTFDQLTFQWNQNEEHLINLLHVNVALRTFLVIYLGELGLIFCPN